MSAPTLPGFERIDLLALHPRLRRLLPQLLESCAARGATYIATSGARTLEEQAKLYAQGRTAPGPKVTNVRYSMHVAGAACDFVRVTGPGKVSWDRADYYILAEEAEKLGLESGHFWTSFPDSPHVQIRLPEGVTLAKLRQVHGKDGLVAVWALL